MKRVVLCRPDGPRNVGMALRVALDFGPCELWLVAPPRASMLVHPEFEQMSNGAEGAHASIRIVHIVGEERADVLRQPDQESVRDAVVAAVRTVHAECSTEDVLAAIDRCDHDASAAAYWALDPAASSTPLSIIAGALQTAPAAEYTLALIS